MADPVRPPKRVRRRYADLLLRCIHQCGGRDRYVAVEELEDALGLEPELILKLCRTRLRGEVHVAQRPPARLEAAASFSCPLEREWARFFFAEPHVRVRPPATRRTEEELLHERRGRRRRKSKRKAR